MPESSVVSQQVGPPLPSQPQWRWQGGPVFTWALPQCPLRVVYSSALLRKVRAAGTQADAFGLLFGVRRGQTVFLVSTRRRAGLEALGSYASRAGGGVFLAEEDLQRFEKVPLCVTLVVSGERAGFFVRDGTGAFGTFGSFQQFSLPPSTRVAAPKPKMSRKAVGAAVCFFLALMLAPFLNFRSGDPYAVSVRDDRGQLHISWNAAAQKVLTILDRGEQISLTIAPHQSSLTYARHSGDVTVGIGSAKVRFIGPAPPRTEIEQIRAGVEALESKIVSLRAVSALGRTKLAALQGN